MPSLTKPPTPGGATLSTSSRLLSFTGHHHLRHRLILSLLSRRPIKISSIRPDSSNPGLRPPEISFLRLVEKLTQGTRVEISYTGTSLLFHPGVLSGGNVTHSCGEEKSVGWFLEPVLAVGGFGKKDLHLTLKGVTTDGKGPSVDVLRTSGLPHLAMFLEKDGLELRITKRGHPPLGGGEVTFSCPSVKSIKSGFDFTNEGKVQKIRGIAHSVRVSPQLANRLVAAARSVLNRYIPDVYIYTDVYRGEDSGKSPGYALTLLSTSTTQVLHSSESASSPPSSTTIDPSRTQQQQTPEDLALLAARQLLHEIRRGGCVDRGWEWLVTLMLVLGGEDVGRVKVGGPFESGFIQHLRDLKSFFGTTFKIKPFSPSLPNTVNTEEEDGDDEKGGKLGEGWKEQELFILSCVGTGYGNTARRMG
ncbi:18S rRNA biogenesis protein [Meredithblackwellia eburnea MCA 4105]